MKFRGILILILIGVCNSAAFGNATDLRECPSDEMFSFKLGMTFAQAEKKTDQKLELKDQLNLPKEYQAASFNKLSQEPPNKVLIGLAFYNDSLYSISASYDESIRWHNIDAFTTWLSPSLNLVPTWMNIQEWDGSIEMAALYCSKTSIVATKLTYNQGRNQARPFSVLLGNNVIMSSAGKLRQISEAKRKQTTQ